MDLTHVYIKPSDLKKINEFKYHGEDHSLIYKHVISPFCDYLVDEVVPSWMAPNLVKL
jgi:hypothetical protein